MRDLYLNFGVLCLGSSQRELLIRDFGAELGRKITDLGARGKCMVASGREGELRTPTSLQVFWETKSERELRFCPRKRFRNFVSARTANFHGMITMYQAPC